MTLRSRHVLIPAIALATLIGSALPASAQQRARLVRAVEAPPGAERMVTQCEAGVIAARNFERRHGVAPVFITAEQALAAQARGEVWSAPRCMTARELARLTAALER